MQTKRIDGIEPLPDDAQLLARLRTETALPACGGVPYVLGISNLDGVMYRVVEARGIDELLRIARLLLSLGFVETQHATTAIRNCRSTFGRPVAQHLREPAHTGP